MVCKGGSVALAVPIDVIAWVEAFATKRSRPSIRFVLQRVRADPAPCYGQVVAARLNLIGGNINSGGLRHSDPARLRTAICAPPSEVEAPAVKSSQPNEGQRQFRSGCSTRRLQTHSYHPHTLSGTARNRRHGSARSRHCIQRRRKNTPGEATRRAGRSTSCPPYFRIQK